MLQTTNLRPMRKMQLTVVSLITGALIVNRQLIVKSLPRLVVPHNCTNRQTTAQSLIYQWWIQDFPEG